MSAGNLYYDILLLVKYKALVKRFYIVEATWRYKVELLKYVPFFSQHMIISVFVGSSQIHLRLQIIYSFLS